jgi:DedD protein
MAFFKFRKGFDSKTAAAPNPQESIETMRRRAKHRLLGATVLVLVAVVGFPMLFDSQPRPVSVDIPIDIPDKNKIKPLAIPAMANAPPLPIPPGVTAAPSNDSVAAAASIGPKEEIVVAKPAARVQEKPAAAAAPNTAPAPAAATAPNTAPAPAAATAPAAAAADDGARAKALLEGREPEKTQVAAAEARFVVQVGAFADADKAMEVRQKLERAGLKTYAQVVDTKDGKRTRVRVGPFADKGQAEQTAEKVKALDLPVAVLAL